MQIELTLKHFNEVDTDCLVAFVVDAGPQDSPQPIVLGGKMLAGLAAAVVDAGELTAKPMETVLLHQPAGLKAKRVLFLGCGKADKIGGVELRRLAGSAVRFLRARSIKNIAFALPAPAEWKSKAGSSASRCSASSGSRASFATSDVARAIVEGALVADFDPDIYKSHRQDLSLERLVVVASPASKSNEKMLAAAVDSARIVGESQNFTRQLVNEPGNSMTPTILAQRAREMAAEQGLKCEILGAKEIQKHKMGAFWAVAKGSEEPPALIVLRYQPSGAPATPVIGLVGKAVTFDSGGISIKPADGMEKMKYDMAGGAAMLGAMRAIALLKPKVRVTAVICATENMPSGKAYKPGDVQIAMSGKSIEIINTDAEGRMILADGLTYARELGCTHLVDAATLTGACVVALGMINAGIFSNDDALYNRFHEAQQSAGEKFWRLPVEDEYQEMIKSGIADIVNSAGRWGGAISAAMFLKEFVEDIPWIHLDIAGIAWMEEAKPWIAKGPTGIAVRSLVQFVKNFA